MKSMTMVTVTPRRAASAVTASIWVLFPSIRTAHSRLWPGSRRSASSNAAEMSSVTEAASHLPRACGSRGVLDRLGVSRFLLVPSVLRWVPRENERRHHPGGGRNR